MLLRECLHQAEQEETLVERVITLKAPKLAQKSLVLTQTTLPFGAQPRASRVVLPIACSRSGWKMTATD